ncbi:MAG: HPF/RaiA family ribosome-associated protein [Deltaproteobacteria bacterium]|nr:HPF/RaiA family ribosome-associated protein [Deltaproteobacteria bacterium]
METPPEITFRGLEKNDEIEARILEKVNKLDEIHPGIISCRVAVEKLQEHQRSGAPYRVRVVVRLPPGKELVGRHELGEGDIRERLQTAVTEAFGDVRRQLIKTKDKQQGKVKAPPDQELIGYVVRLFRDEGYGFIRTTEGREIYFHQHAVLHDDFQRLEIGTGVRYFPSEGDEGPQASTVQVVDKTGSRVSKVEEPQIEPPAGVSP